MYLIRRRGYENVFFGGGVGWGGAEILGVWVQLGGL